MNIHLQKRPTLMIKQLISLTFFFSFTFNAIAASTTCSGAGLITSAGTYVSLNQLGHQWFKYKNNNSYSQTITVSSCNKTSADTYLQIFATCSSTSSLAYNNDFCEKQSSVTYTLSPYQTVYIRWGNFFTSSNFTFSLAVTEAQNTTCSNAKTVTAGTHIANNSLGDQWFKYTNSSTKTKELTISSCGYTSYNTYLKLYKSCNSSYTKYSYNSCNSQSEIVYEIDPNETIYLLWDNLYTSGSYTWKLEENEVSNTTCTNALEVTEGIQRADNSKGEQWYKYTNNTEIDKEVSFSTCGLTTEKTYVKLYTSCSGNYVAYDRSSCSNQSQLNYTVKPNQTIYVNWDDYYSTTASYDWEFSIVGQTNCNDATAVSLGEQNSSTADGSQLFSYTNSTNSEQSLTISSCDLAEFNTFVKLYSTCSGEKNEITSNDDYCGVQSYLTYTIQPNETIYIEWLDIFFRGDFDWIITTDEVTVNGISKKSKDPNTYVFPNPSSNIFHLTSNHQITQVELLSMDGSLLKNIKGNSTDLDLNLAGMSSGLYTLKIYTTNGITVSNIVKE
jgi:hypothetical protein